MLSNSNAHTFNYNNGRKIKWISDLEKGCLLRNFEERGWVRGTRDEWNFFWATVGSFRSLMSRPILNNKEANQSSTHGASPTPPIVSTSPARLTDAQILNHFPNNGELTRKDMLAKNIKRYSRERTRRGSTALDYLPQTFTLPGDYNLFLAEFRSHNPPKTYIMKPTDRSQGNGIFLVRKLGQVKSFEKRQGWSYANQRDSYVVSKYIDSPLLIGQKKFDLRLYVLVTTWHPQIKAYKYREGFARFCAVEYSNAHGQLRNNLVHLTNVAIQKHGEDYNEANGGKWSFSNLLLYIESTRGREVAKKLVNDIDFIFKTSLLAVQGLIANDKHCFECYGYDIIVDSDIKPWLVEVNASPSLSSTTVRDKALKHKLIQDLLDVVIKDKPHFQKATGIVAKEDTVAHDTKSSTRNHQPSRPPKHSTQAISQKKTKSFDPKRVNGFIPLNMMMRSE